MGKFKQLLAAVAAVVLATGAFGGVPTGLFVNGVSVGDNSAGDGWEFAKNRIWLNDSYKTYRVSGEDKSGKIGVHIIAKSCTMIADNLILCPTNSDKYAAIQLDPDKKLLTLYLELVGKNKLIGGSMRAGIGVPDNAWLHISAPADSAAELECESEGFGAGIGGDYDRPDSGMIQIHGGTIRARGGYVHPEFEWGGGGAGIGGSSCYEFSANWSVSELKGGDCSWVQIYGGTVYAYGTGGSAGIGGGCGASDYGSNHGGNCGKVEICGGRVFAYGSDAYYVASGGGAGIGGGSGCTEVTEVDICGGTVYAEGGDDARGCQDIGVGALGEKPEAGKLYIGGGSLTTKYDLMLENRYGREKTPLHEVKVGPFVAHTTVNAFGLQRLVDGEWKSYGYALKDLYAAADGYLHFYLPDGTFKFNAGESKFQVTVAGANKVASIIGDSDHRVVLDANGGTLNGAKTVVKTLAHGSLLKELPEPEREGYAFLGWRENGAAGNTTAPLTVTREITLYAQWKSDTQSSSGSSTVGKVVFRFLANGGHFADGSEVMGWAYAKGGKISELENVPRPVWGDSSREFFGWWDYDTGKYLANGDVVTSTHTIYAIWEKKSTEVTFYPGRDASLTTPEDYKKTDNYVFDRSALGSFYISPGVWDGHVFVGWFSEPGGKGVEYVQGSKATDSTPSVFYGYWKLVNETWLMNRYWRATVGSLGANRPSGYKSLTAENLPKGLSLIRGSDTDWYIEGVPTETRDVDTNFIAIRFKMADKNAPDVVKKVMLSIIPDVHGEMQFNLGEIVTESADTFFGYAAAGVTVDASWKITAGNANIKYTAKELTWKDSDKVQHVAPALSFYGQPNKLGAFTVVGKRTVKSGVPGNEKKSYTETYSAEVLVRPASGSYDGVYTVYANELMDIIDATDVLPSANDPKSTSSTPPTGMKFTSKEIAYNKDYDDVIPAGSYYGKPTKTGIYAMTLKDKDKFEGHVLVRVADPAAPEVGAYFGTKKTKLIKAISKGVEGAEQNRPITLMVGATTSIPLSASAGAALKASNLPSGLKLVQDKATKLWTISGAPTKAGTFLATVTATLNKVSTTVSFIFEVEANAFAGEWRGYMFSGARETWWKMGIAGLTVNVAAGGATKVTLFERGETSSYSFKSFDWDELNGNASVTFTTKATKELPVAREVTIEIVDKGGWYAVGGRVYRADAEWDGVIEAYPVVPVATLNEHGILTNLASVYDWNFTEHESVRDFDYPFALCSTVLDAKKGTAKVAGNFTDDSLVTKIAVASLPIVRTGADADDRASYAFAPFAVYDKVTGSMKLFTLALDGSDFDVIYDDRVDLLLGRDTISCTAAAVPKAGKPIADSLLATNVLFFDFGSRNSEVFHLAAAGKGKFEVYDTLNNKLASLNVKFGADGLGTFSFTTADKADKYTVTLFDCGNGRLTGSVSRVFKSYGSNTTRIGIADVY